MFVAKHVEVHVQHTNVAHIGSTLTSASSTTQAPGTQQPDADLACAWPAAYPSASRNYQTTIQQTNTSAMFNNKPHPSSRPNPRHPRHPAANRRMQTPAPHASLQASVTTLRAIASAMGPLHASLPRQAPHMEAPRRSWGGPWVTAASLRRIRMARRWAAGQGAGAELAAGQAAGAALVLSWQQGRLLVLSWQQAARWRLRHHHLRNLHSTHPLL
jgi:hypothetical protein